MDADRLLVHLAALGGATNRRSVGLWRRRSDLFADYVGIFAVERGTVVGQTLVKRLSYAFPGGAETIGAVASVATRPDRARHGVAQRILAEVHARERAAGIRVAALWTNPSWGAHQLYEKLGYRDVHALPWAVRLPGRGPGARTPVRGVRPAWPSDLHGLGELHDRWAEGRLGFCRRPLHSFELASATHEIEPTKELVLARDGGELAGYAHVQATPNRVVCGELVANSPDIEGRLVREIERRAGDGPVAVVGTAVRDLAGLLGRRGYRRLDRGWWTFMAKSLERDWDARTAIRALATNDPRYVCQSGDRF